MIKHILLLSLAFGLGNLFGQTITGRIDFGKKEANPNFIVHSPTDNGLVTLGPASRVSTRYIALTKFDQHFEKSWKKEIFTQNGRKNLDFMTLIGENILVFVSEFKPQANVIETYYFRYNLEGEMLEDKTILSVSPNEKNYRTDLRYVLSSNKKTLLCYRNLENRRESESMLYFVFDETGQQTRNGEIALKYPDNRFTISWVRVSNQGNVYFLGKFYKVNRIRDPEDYDYLMFRYKTVEHEMEEFSIELGERFVNDLAFKIDRDEHIFVTGFYSNRSTDRITGVLVQQIGPDGKIIQETAEAFGEAFLSNYLSSRQIDRGRELRNFRIMDPDEGIVLRSDGGLLLLAENYYLTEQTFVDRFNNFTSRTLYNFGDVILTSISPEGYIEWHAIVDKYQFTDNPQLMSYFSAAGPAGLLVFYELNPTGAPRNVYYNSIGIDGQVSARRPLLQDFRGSSDFVTNLCQQISNTEALLGYYQKRGKILSLVRVDLRE
ncbi:MAG: hypothetical protein R3B47_16680 [Bacteroidia bacterium]